MGRPLKICEDHITLLDEYIGKCGDTYERLLKSQSESIKGSSESWDNVLNVELPTYAGYLVYLFRNKKEIKINKDTLCEWKNIGKEPKKETITENEYDLFVRFSESLDSLLFIQEQMLLNGGVSNKYGQVITKLILSANHGYSETEKKEVKVSGSLDLSGFFDEKKEKDVLINKE